MFTIRRKGEFSAFLVAGTPHCGIGEDVIKTFNYEAWICMKPEGLDGRGFVVDNKVFKQFFDAQLHLTISCEQLALNAARHFFKLASAGKRKDLIVEVCVQIWGLPGEAYAEYKWVRSDNVSITTKVAGR